MEDTIEPTGTPVDRLYHDDVLAARRMTPDEKLLAGPQLFDFPCRIALDGVQTGCLVLVATAFGNIVACPRWREQLL